MFSSLENLLRNFFWEAGSRINHLVNWKQVTHLMMDGLEGIKVQNTALLA